MTGLIVTILAGAIVDEITVVVPGVGLPIHAGQAIRGVVLIRRDLRARDRRRLCRAVVDGVVGILERGRECAGRIRLGQAIQAFISNKQRPIPLTDQALC